MAVATHIIVAPTYLYEPGNAPAKQYEPIVGVSAVLGAVATGVVEPAVFGKQTMFAPE